MIVKKVQKFLTIALLVFVVSTSQMKFIAVVGNNDSFSLLQQESDYVWIWQELVNAPRQVIGEDVVYWGANLGPYHNYTELTKKLLSLNNSFPEIVDVFPIGATRQNRTIWAVRITNESVTATKSEFYIVAAHHAREIISVENALYFIDRLVYEAEYGINPTNAQPSFEVQEMLSSEEIYVIPMLNPDGISILHWYPEQRKNLAPIDDDNDGTTADEEERVYYWDAETNTSDILEQDLDEDGTIGEDRPGGVDLNRNYAAFWNETGGSSDIPWYDNYRGPEPFSEPETRAMRDFMNAHNFNLAISLHSGIKAIISPWGVNNSIPLKDHDEIVALVDKLKQITGFPFWNDIGGYMVSGEWGDYSFLYHDILAFTIETYGGNWNGNWFDYFNPPGNRILSNCELIFDALYFMAKEPRLTYNNTLPVVEVMNPPKENLVEDNYTIQWVASDTDNDPLTADIYISQNGLNWQLIASDIPSNGSYLWEIGDTEPGSYYIKVAVYDGKDWTHDITEIRLNVKVNPKVSLISKIIIWGSVGLVGVITILYYGNTTRKAKEISKMWGKEQ